MLHHSLNSTGTVQPNALIQRSWARCERQAGALDSEPVLLDRAELNTRMDQYASLLHTATPHIAAASGIVAHAQGILLLSDASGVILHSTGNNAFLHKADQVALRPGASWAEDHRGTNAIGTALIENAFIRVHGQEHYLSCNRILSCHAAPIRSPRGDILGVLDISGDARTLPDYTGDLVRATARQIGDQILDLADTHIARLQFQRQPGPINPALCGTLLVADEYIVGASEVAADVLGVPLTQLLDQAVENWLPQWKQLQPHPSASHVVDGTVLYATLQFERIGVPNSDNAAAAQTGHAGSIQAKSPADKDRTKPAGLPAASLPTLEPALQLALRQSTLAINADLGILLLGETGTGKEVFARHLHAHSRWRNGPFIAINCAALPESLIEAELFGYEPGAFTGAQRNGSRGRLRDANGGVLFLDEIGDMPLPLQSRLLRVLQERVVQPLGSDKAWPVQFGLISATNQQAEILAQEENFRQDLYYRIQDHLVHLPPLRQRADLRMFICAELRRHESSPSLIFDDETLDILCACPWPGNYRQLRSVLKTLAAFLPTGSIIRPDALPVHLLRQVRGAPSAAPETRAGSAASNSIPAPEALACNPTADTNILAPFQTQSDQPLPDVSLKDLQTLRIRQALVKNRGNVSKTARELGLHRSTVYRQLARSDSSAP
ncbi:ATPase AAA [Advenella kashmirensis W13003]|uniref:ATPase AAA n=1 Tax=Advenella kashmirensis W13003 TaxID=1424334 RepID=V8QTR0_9BURK|nr:sigma-54-dependent Fis family transcriptional regulator [Advenella kashmirensis]ETF02705.1 ATPase AAA [Advenella kashmirensis W13003]